MNKEFDFDDIGKRIPYRTPETFFEHNRREILKHTCGEERHERNRFRVIVPAILVVAALLVGILFMPFSHEEKRHTRCVICFYTDGRNGIGEFRSDG